MPSMLLYPSLRGQALFDKICELAIAGNQAELTRLWESGACLHVFSQQYRSVPATWLAEKKEHDAVNLLVDHFLIDRHAVAHGYARAGYTVQEIEQYIKEQRITGHAIWENVLSGYAYGNHKKQVKQLLDRKFDLFYAVYGYAFANHVDQVNAFLDKSKDNRLVLMVGAVKGYIEVGNIVEVDRLLSQIDTMNIDFMGRIEIMDDLIFVYACVGQINQVNVLLQRRANFEQAMIGYALRDYMEHVNQLWQRIKIEDRVRYLYAVIYTFARGGHFQRVEQILEHIHYEFSWSNVLAQLGQPCGSDILRGCIMYALKGCARVGQVHQVNQLLESTKQLISQELADSYYHAVIDGYEGRGYLSIEEDMHYLLALTQHEKLRDLLVRRVVTDVSSADLILKRAAQQYRLMQEYEFSYQYAQMLSRQSKCESMGSYAWLVCGQSLVRDGKLPANIFFYIAACTMGSTVQAAPTVYRAVHTRLFRDVKKHLNQKDTDGFFVSKNSFLREIGKCKERYQRRMRTLNVESTEFMRFSR